MQNVFSKIVSGLTSQTTDQPQSNLDVNRPPVLTTRNGAPLPSDSACLTAGERGPILLQDIYFVEKQAAMNRERIPERVVHAKGGGAYGTFTVTGDITDYTVADLFSEIGKETPVVVRFSRATGGSDSADTARDVRGFAIKFYTNQGNWDLVGNNHPVFFVRDPIKFMDVIHTFQKDPRNGTGAPIPMWDFFSQTPESIHHVTMLFSDRGTPMSYRTMHGFGANTYSFINKNQEVVFVKFHLICQQGIKNFTKDQAGLIAGQDPDFMNRDLFESIQEGKYPQWKLCVQVMPSDQAWKYPHAFDATKVWNHSEFPLIEVGVLELNRNATDFFAEMEQSAFSPSNVVPGISFSPDRVLQGRLFAYPDTQRYRLGVNYPFLPVNCPHYSRISTYQREGQMLPIIENKFPHYNPNSLSGPAEPTKEQTAFSEIPMCIPDSGVTNRFDPRPPISNDEDFDLFKQARDLFNLLSQDAKERLADNIATSLETVPTQIVEKQLALFDRCDREYGRMVRDNLNLRKKGELERTQAEWVKSAAVQLLKSEWKEDILPPVKDISNWPEKFKKFELHSTAESESVHAKAIPAQMETTATKAK